MSEDNFLYRGILILPSQQPSPLFKCHDDYLQFDSDLGINYVKSYIDYKHIFITSDEKIRSFDHVISENSIRPIFIDGVINTCEMLLEDHWKKVIATSDPIYWHERVKDTSIKEIPKIEFDFIEFCAKQDGELERVLVEYEDVCECRGKHITCMSPAPCTDTYDRGYKLKLTSNGAIIFKNINNRTYTEDECKRKSSTAFWAGYANESIKLDEAMKIHNEWQIVNYPK